MLSAYADRFWAQVVEGPGTDQCWLWTGAINDDGYGVVWVRVDGRAKVLRAHRMAYTLVMGEPAGVVMHGCDVPICCRVTRDPLVRSHLIDGTQRENLGDMAAKGRGYGGDKLRARHGRSGRAERVRLSRALRAAVRGGWDDEAVAAALADPDLDTLF